MNFAREQFKVGDVVDQFDRGLVVPNPEYQRGATWDLSQKKSFIDSLFRRYPLPAIFLHERRSRGLRGDDSSKFEIVDGQQRIRSLVEFRQNRFELLEVSDKRLRIPHSLRSQAVPWQGLTYDRLPVDLRHEFDSHLLDAYSITGVASDDEIRDLFIRLQSGKPLSPQQVRDAWPGPVGPFVERLAGKLDRVPALNLFDKIDRRGNKDEESRDKHVTHRVICSQLLLLFLERSRHPDNFCAISSKNLDQLYHENTGFEADSPAAERFLELLQKTEKVISYLEGRSGKAKFRKLDVIAVFCLLHDLSYMRDIRMDTAHFRKLAELVEETSANATAKTTSLVAVTAAASKLRERAQREPDLMIRLDPQRTFDEEQRRQISASAEGMCSVCNLAVADEDAEYDHFPVAWARGGRTEIANARLVHARCHPRHGRIPEE